MKALSKWYGAMGVAAASLAFAGSAFAQTPDITAPTVSAITPITAQANVETTFSASYSDSQGVTSCELWVDSANQGSMTASGSTSGTATRNFTLTTTGNHTLQARCRDAAGNIGLGTQTTVTVSAQGSDSLAPVVGAITPTTANVNASTTFSASFTDANGVTSCDLWVNGANQGSMSLSGSTSGTATRNFTLTATGNHTLQARCRDAAGNIGTGASTTVTATQSGSDVVPPSVGSIAPTNASLNASTAYTVSYSDATGVTSCDLWVNGANQGSMSLSGSTSGTATRNYTLTATGTNTLQARCRDAAGNIGTGAQTSVSVSSGPGPTVGAIIPVGASLNTPTTFSATYSDSDAVTGCELFVDGFNQGSMSLSGSTSGTATKSATLTTTGDHMLQVRCRDAAGNESTSIVTGVSVTGSVSVDTSAPTMPTNLRLTGTAAGRADLAWNASQDNTAVTGYEVKVDSGAFVDLGNFLTTQVGPLTDGPHSVSIRARDAAGNVSGSATLGFTLSGGISTSPGLPPFSLTQMSLDANVVLTGSLQAHLDNIGRSCELTDADATARVNATLGTISDASVRANIINFTRCGTVATLHLGAGERLGVVNSFKASFGKLPSAHADWNDVIKIANGRFPGQVSTSAETAAKARFKVIYLRDANMGAAFDANAVVVMAYGLRPLPRNLSSEAVAQAHFRGIFGYTASSATDWDAVRAIAYSGATR